jgi:hypothetical protein
LGDRPTIVLNTQHYSLLTNLLLPRHRNVCQLLLLL